MKTTIRKMKEAEAFRQMVLDESYKMIKSEGLKEFSMRKLALAIGWSTQKLYSSFENKEEILKALGKHFRDLIWEQQKSIVLGVDPLKYLLSLTRVSLLFFSKEPAAYEILIQTHLENGEEPLEKAQEVYQEALKALKIPSLKGKKAFQMAIDAIRMLLIGATQYMQKVPEESRDEVLKAAESALRTLLIGYGMTQKN